MIVFEMKLEYKLSVRMLDRDIAVYLLPLLDSGLFAQHTPTCLYVNPPVLHPSSFLGSREV